MSKRKYLPTLAELIDRLSIIQLKEVFISEHKKEYADEIKDINTILNQQRSEIIKLDSAVTAFNIGINDGKDAGQSIHHLHIHLIPRREGDVENPKGGVRGVIPAKQKYVRKDG